VSQKHGSIIKKQPARLWLAAGGLLIAGTMGWIRFTLALVNFSFYQSLGVQPGVWYLVANGFLIGIVYTLAGIIVLSRADNIKIAVYLMFTGLAVFWVDRIFFARSIEAQTALPYSLVSSAGLTVLATCLAFWEIIDRRIRNGRHE
jgi:hypothetical protein